MGRSFSRGPSGSAPTLALPMPTEQPREEEERNAIIGLLIPAAAVVAAAGAAAVSQGPYFSTPAYSRDPSVTACTRSRVKTSRKAVRIGLGVISRLKGWSKPTQTGYTYHCRPLPQ